MTDYTVKEVKVPRHRNRVWRMVQFAVVTLVMMAALMNVFIWQFVISEKDVAALIIVGFLYFVSFLECFNYYHYDCPFCGMELKTSDFDLTLSKRCPNCGHGYFLNYVDHR